MGDDTCTVDGHARNIAYNERVNLTDNRTNIGIKEYANLQEAYRQAAKRCKVDGRQMKPYELQAITWVTWRKLHGIAWQSLMYILCNIYTDTLVKYILLLRYTR